MDTAIASLHIVGQLHQLPVNPVEIQHKFSVDGRALDRKGLIQACLHVGLKSKIIQSSVDRIPKLAKYNVLPAMLEMNDGRFAVLAANWH